MARVAKILAIVIGGLLAVVILAAAYILLVVDPNDYKGEIAKVVKDKTDMDLTLSDRLSWQFWPNIRLHLGKTALTDTAAGNTLVAIDKADVSVQLMPLFAKRIAIDEVILDGAKLDFIRHADGSTSWDRMLNKLKSAPEEKSDKIDFKVSVLDISNSSLHFRDDGAKLDGKLDKLLVQASNIGLKKAFPVRVKFGWAQTDANGKTLTADNDLDATVTVDSDAGRYLAKSLSARSHLGGTLLPAPVTLDLGADVDADVNGQKHVVDSLKLAVDYADPKLTKPAHVELGGKISADLKAQTVALDGFTVKASYPMAGLKAPATVDLKTAVLADLKQQIVKASGIAAHAVYPDPNRPSPLTADLSGEVTANLTSGALDFAPLDVKAVISDKAFAKTMPVHLTAPVSANWKEGKVALNGFQLDALDIRTQGQLLAALPALAAAAKPGTPATQGMTVSGKLSTSPFNLRTLMQTLGMTAPATADANTLKNVSLSTAISGNDNSLLLKGISAKLDDSTLTGEAGLSDLKTGKIYARLAVDRIDLDRYLPPPAATPAPAAKAPAGGELLPVELLRKQNLDVGLTIGALTAMKYPVQKFQVSATAADGVVKVSQLGGNVLGGSFSLPATIDVRGKQPALSVSPNVQKLEIANLAQRFTKKDLLAGKGSYTGNLKLSGNTMDAWMNSVSGDSSLKFDNGILKGVNLTQLVVNEMGKYQTLLPLLTGGKDAATLVSKQNDTEIASFLGEATITNGTVQTKTMNADLRKGKIAGSGSFNLVTMDLDSRFTVNLDKSLVGEKGTQYAFPVHCKGKISSPASLCGVDGGAMKEIAAKALLNSEKVQKLQADLNSKQAEMQQKATEKMDAETKKAADKVGEKLNEQLQKLFKR